MSLIEEPEFPLSHQLRLVALQGDCSLKYELEAAGGRYVVVDAARARQSCVELIDRALSTHAHLALVPGLAIPRDALHELIDTINSRAESRVLIGGVEGISPADYRTLVVNCEGPSRKRKPFFLTELEGDVWQQTSCELQHSSDSKILCHKACIYRLYSICIGLSLLLNALTLITQSVQIRALLTKYRLKPIIAGYE